MGMGFQRDLTVRENVFMYSLMNNVPEHKAMAQIEQIATLAGLQSYLDTPLHHCPSGSYIRLAFSAVINLSADIILADEVLAVGDGVFQAECIKQIQIGSKVGKSVLFVSHDLEAIKKICHRVVWLDKGRIVMDGDPEEVADRYTEALLGRLEFKRSQVTQSRSVSRIEHMRLVSLSGSEIGALGIANAAAVEFMVRMGGLARAFRIHAACFHDGKIVFTSSQPGCQISPSHEWHRVRLTLPAHYFNELTYEFRAVLEVIEDAGSEFFEVDKPMQFKAYNANAADSAWGDWPWGRPGYICPKLNWQLRVSRGTAD
jgi:ABC-type uncharacterized transport system ATPase subunit